MASGNRTAYWRSTRLPGVRLMQAELVDHRYPPHSHQAVVVAATEAGGSDFVSRGATQTARPGRLLVFNPDEPHSGHLNHSSGWRYRAFYVDEGGLAQLRDHLSIDPAAGFTANTVDDPALVRAFLRLHHALDTAEPMAAEELLQGSFGRLFTRHGDRRPAPEPEALDDRRLARALELLHARHGESVLLKEVAAEVGLTPFQLIAGFKRRLGMTPHARLLQFRLDAAAALMRQGQPPARAAVEAGFYDQSALNRHFKRAYGVTPGQFARAEAVIPVAATPGTANPGQDRGGARA
jgi:AraC-like DNA-binding protein